MHTPNPRLTCDSDNYEVNFCFLRQRTAFFENATGESSDVRLVTVVDPVSSMQFSLVISLMR